MPLNRDLPDLIRSHLKSVWSLELLLLLRRTPDRSWTPQGLCDELRATLALVAAGLEHFERSGLVARDAEGLFHYAPASALLAEFGDQVEAQYRERPVSVINLIAAPEDRIQQLADAFRFRSRAP